MAALVPRVAQIRTESGAVFEASLANLSERGAFLRTGADLRFRDLLHIKVLDLELRAQVLLVSDAPAGVVVTFLDPSLSMRAVLARHEAEVEVLPGQGGESADPWTEDTAASGDMEPLPDALDGSTEEDFPQELVKLATGDLDPLPVEPATEGLDPGLFAAAMMDDGAFAEVPILDPVSAAPGAAFSHTEPGVEAFDPLESPFDPGAQDALTPLSAAPVLDVPVDDLMDEPPTPSDPVRSFAAAPPAPPVAPEVQDVLPSLERDGYTVRFDSADAYADQLQNHLRHGGLVVRADPIAIGTQRMLALVVPGQAAYTVSARVIFHDQGKLGFMLDSFALHKNRLEQLAG